MNISGRERTECALTMRGPDRAPRELWALPGVEMSRKQELAALLERFPPDIAVPPSFYAPARRAAGTPNVRGSYTDEWGCVWQVTEEGTVGEVKAPPLADWSALDRFEPPWEVLEGVDLERVNAFAAGTDKFVRAATPVRLFERLQFLRGPEQLLMDLAEQPPEFFAMRDQVHTFFLRELELWAQSQVDGVAFMDDWGTQHHMLVAPDLWRTLFKPLYREYCEVLKAAGKFVFFHTDGNMEAILEDLIEIGVDAINSQLFCMDIEGLGARYRGRITFWGEICRQQVLPFGTPADVHAAVQRVRRALDDGRGGVIAQCEWGLHDPAENIAAVFEAWL